MKAQMFNYATWVPITNPKLLKDKCEALLVKAGFGIEGFMEKHFEPQGYSAIWILSESHFAIHTFPEHGESYLELSSCSKKPFDMFVSIFALSLI